MLISHHRPQPHQKRTGRACNTVDHGRSLPLALCIAFDGTERGGFFQRTKASEAGARAQEYLPGRRPCDAAQTRPYRSPSVAWTHLKPLHKSPDWPNRACWR